ncbi:MAG: hypothetical protein JRJ73_16200 [Deltaproteobacteria bacterium]|nr:hypothetical protein [Deltaproteobacteria bacterium]
MTARTRKGMEITISSSLIRIMSIRPPIYPAVMATRLPIRPAKKTTMIPISSETPAPAIIRLRRSLPN